MKWGWLLGGLGSILWLPLMSAIRLAQGHWLWPLAGLGIFLAGLAYLFLMAPWRHPRAPVALLYLGFLAIPLAGAAAVYVEYRDTLGPGEGLPWLVLLAFLIPMFTLGRRRWADLQSRGG